MTQEDKELLLKDLCARLPYEMRVRYTYAFAGAACINEYSDEGTLSYNKLQDFSLPNVGYERRRVVCILPYLRPLASMTGEEKEELLNLLFDKEAKYFYIDKEGFIDGKISDLMKEGINYPSFCPINIELYTDFLLSHHFDYRGLIEKGLAIEAPEGMYEY